MSITLVCPSCNARWKIIGSSDIRDKPVTCVVCESKKKEK